MKPTSSIVFKDGDSHTARMEELIREQNFPMTPETRAAMNDLIAAETPMVAHAVLRAKREGLERARTTCQQLQSQVAAHEPRVAETEAARSKALPGSLGCAILMTPFAAACLAMEFVISWSAFCWLFGVEPRSPLGVMLGVGPTAALAVLKVVFARLFEQPYQDLRNGVLHSPASRVVAGATMVLILATVGLFNLYTVIVQARLREDVAIAVRNVLEDDDSVVYEPVDSEEAVVATSLAVSINGAILFVIAWNEAFNWRRRRSATRAAEAERATLRELQTAVASATAELSMLSQEDIERSAKEAGERWRAELLLMCHSESARQVQQRTPLQAVKRNLQLVQARAS
jgi:hypothetical protein